MLSKRRERYKVLIVPFRALDLPSLRAHGLPTGDDDVISCTREFDFIRHELPTAHRCTHENISSEHVHDERFENGSFTSRCIYYIIYIHIGVKEIGHRADLEYK